MARKSLLKGGAERQFRLRFGPAHPKPQPSEKLCPRCGDLKPITEFYAKPAILPSGRRATWRASHCRSCHDVIVRAWQARNREAMKLYQRQWSLDHGERRREQKREQRRRRPEHFRDADRAAHFKRKAIGGYNPTLKAVRAAVAETLELYRMGDRYLDAYTGNLIESPTIDHVVPLAEGGTNTADNFCVTSVENNSSKHAHSLLWWLVRRRTATCRDF